MKQKEHYFEVALDVSLTTSAYVFGSINISHIPYAKWEEVFHAQIIEYKDRFLFENSSYQIDEALYQLHEAYLKKEIPFTFDFTLFEYSVGISSIKRADVQKYYHKQLPSFLTNASESEAG